MAKKELPSWGSLLKAYQVFHQAADRGNYRKAFQVFKKQPELINHMTLVEISSHLAVMPYRLSQQEVGHFLKYLQKDFLSMQRWLRIAKEYDRYVRKKAREKRGRYKQDERVECCEKLPHKASLNQHS